MSKTIYIAPSVLDEDIAGSCNFYMKNLPAGASARDDYRANPRDWKHVGHMNSSGRIISLDHEAVGRQLGKDLLESQPLMAGASFRQAASDHDVLIDLTVAQLAAARNEGVLIAAPQRNAWPAVYSVQPQHVPREDIPESINWPAQHGHMVAHFHEGQWFKPGGWEEIRDPQAIAALNSVTEVWPDFSVRESVHAERSSAPRG